MLGSYDVQGTARHRLSWKWLKQPQLFWQWKLSNLTPAHNSISTMRAGLPSLVACMFIHVTMQFLEKKITYAQPSPNPIQRDLTSQQPEFRKISPQRGLHLKTLELLSVIHSHGGFGRLSSGSSSGVASGARSFRLFAGDDMTQWGEALESLALITVITSFLKCVYDAGCCKNAC